MDKTFAEALRRIRTERDFSQQSLAEKLCVDRSTIAGWETGRRLPDATLIKRLSECLNVDIAILMNAAGMDDENLNVIMLDDEKIILKGGIPILEEVLPGTAITGFTKPSEALAFARNNRIFLAFLDIEIGKTKGLDVCRQLLEINPRTNVVFLTAYMEYSFDAWDTGACGFLLKPLSAEAVRRQLSRLRYPVRTGGEAI
ncbi:MAG: helix-turn-helix domain-containing protein [Lachnospiraceae bacterium]|nr:helix-turn-helix domain-containing protein [Lachnospiraceae bacterium]